MNPNTNSASAANDGNSVPACFFFADVIDRSISGYQVCKAIQQVIGTRGKVTGAQVLNGLYRIYLSSNEARKILIAQGVTIGDTYVSVIEVNPKIVRGAEQSPSVKIIIGNIPLSVSNDEIENGVKNVEGVHLRSRLFFENYRDDEGGLSSFKTGRRFAYIDPPSKPLPHRFQVGMWKATLYHWGQKKKNAEIEDKPLDDTQVGSPEIPAEPDAEEKDESINVVESSEPKGESPQINLSASMQPKIDSFIPPRRHRSRSKNKDKSRRGRSGSSRKRPPSSPDLQHSPSLKSKKNVKGFGTNGSTKGQQKPFSYTGRSSTSISSPVNLKNSYSALSSRSKSPR